MAVPLVDKGVVVVAVDYDVAPKVVCTCAATLLALTWQLWFSPPTGPSTVCNLRLKLQAIHLLCPPLAREVALRNSPSELVSQLQLSSSGCHIIMAVAENDSPEFHKQSEEYYKVGVLNHHMPAHIRSCRTCYVHLCFPTSKLLEASGLNVSMENVANTDHFNIIEQLVDGDYHLTKVNTSTHHRSMRAND
ncbi:unnamed protein product [Tetraodon nigroviridis]|uniref:(spotted green pufferfish) hypothetical protein n=1 Tax=Tetraodon nigroviridis TaxID=99883 RepID=Q4S017_TETNG|nr:unnamed protein product [Tetraodon nigroviridis]